MTSAEPVVLAHDLHESDQPGVAVLLHSLALDRRVWDPLIEPLSRVRRLVVPDLRGHGKSPTSEGFTVEDMADDVAHTLVRLGIDRVAVVGMSMGGSVALALAIRHPDLVEALGLVDTTAWYGPDAPAAWEQRANKAATEGLRALSEFQLDRWFSDGFRAAHPDLCRALLDVFAANDLASYVSSCRALGAADLREGAARLRVPTAVVVGELDEATPPSHAEDLRDRIAGSTLHVIAGSKHLTPYEHPAEVAEKLIRVLR